MSNKKLIGTLLGHEVHIFMPEFVSEERKKLLELYGAILHINNDEHDAFNDRLIFF